MGKFRNKKPCQERLQSGKVEIHLLKIDHQATGIRGII
jgi:hypothetical protein